MFEAAVLLSKVRKLRTTGVAAALQSGGACTLFAEAAGAAGLELPEFAREHEAHAAQGAAATSPRRTTRSTSPVRRRSRREMYEGALEALANDPAVGVDRLRRVPAADRGRDPVGRAAAAQGRRSCARTTGVAFASVAMSPLAYGPAAKAFTRKHSARLPAGPPCRGRRARGAGRAPGVGDSRGRPPLGRRTRTGPRRSARCAARSGPIDERTARRGSSGCTASRDRRSAPSRRPPRRRRSLVRSGSRSSSRPRRPRFRTRRSSAACGSGSRTRPTSRAAAAEVLAVARRAGARAPRRCSCSRWCAVGRCSSARWSTIGSAR